MDLAISPVRKAGFKSLYLWCKQNIKTLKNQLMSNVLTKQVQNKISRYFLHLENHLSKPESRCVREMTTGILKSGTVLVNKIATGIRDNISLSQTTKRFRNHYNKINFFQKLFRGHMNSIKGRICHGDYILFDGSDIQKKYAKMMEGLDYVKDGDQASVGLGYWLMDVVHFSKDKEMTPLLNKLYSFDHGAKSENKEIMEAIEEVDTIIDKDVTKIFDRGMDRPICRDFIIAGQGNFNLRLKKTTKLIYKGEETPVNKISRKVPLFMELTATKINKSKKHKVAYECGAIKVKYKIKNKEHDLWLVVTKRKNGGYCWLLTRSPKENIVDVIKEAFTAYGFRWKIEEYHRHIKSCYNLEDIQIKTFEGLQSMLAILTIAMSVIYSSLSSLHIKLLLLSGVKTLNKEKMDELHNFIYYKISTIIKVLLANMTPRAFLPQPEIPQDGGQLSFALNYEL
ncbi:MAG: transposase [Draconibacterium sp.]|nr:transposase [Draconibacterium sp.]